MKYYEFRFGGVSNHSDNDSLVGMCEDSLLDIFLLLFLHRFDFLQQEAVNGRHQTGIVVA